jgi:aminoglycoside 6'-N-acetyltransferase
MSSADFALVRGWLTEPHVARWYLGASSVEDELEELHQCVDHQQPTEALIVEDHGCPIGWCQWYRCDDYPEHAAGVRAEPGDLGIDYAIGDASPIGVGVGTVLIATLVGHARRRYADAGVIADPESANMASRRVLEKNGFHLLDERIVASEPAPAHMAIYRLPGDRSPRTRPLS